MKQLENTISTYVGESKETKKLVKFGYQSIYPTYIFKLFEKYKVKTNFDILEKIDSISIIIRFSKLIKHSIRENIVYIFVLLCYNDTQS